MTRGWLIGTWCLVINHMLRNREGFVHAHKNTRLHPTSAEKLRKVLVLRYSHLLLITWRSMCVCLCAFVLLVLLRADNYIIFVVHAQSFTDSLEASFAGLSVLWTCICVSFLNCVGTGAYIMCRCNLSFLSKCHWHFTRLSWVVSFV